MIKEQPFWVNGQCCRAFLLLLWSLVAVLYDTALPVGVSLLAMRSVIQRPARREKAIASKLTPTGSSSAS